MTKLLVYLLVNPSCCWHLTLGPASQASIETLLLPRVDKDLVGKWILFAGQDWRNVIFVPVDNSHDLHGSLLKGRFHCTSDLDPIW